MNDSVGLELEASCRGVSDAGCDAAEPSLEVSYAKGTEQTDAFGNSMSALILAVHFGPLFGPSTSAPLTVHFGPHFGPIA